MKSFLKRRTVFIPEYIGGVILEVKINREIRNYTEAMFFGLSLRQFIFSVLACGVAVGIYFLLRPYVGTETVSWMCILGAAPFALLGFVKYNGMTAEKFMWAWIKSEALIPKKLCFHSTNRFDFKLNKAIGFIPMALLLYISDYLVEVIGILLCSEVILASSMTVAINSPLSRSYSKDKSPLYFFSAFFTLLIPKPWSLEFSFVVFSSPDELNSGCMSQELVITIIEKLFR